MGVQALRWVIYWLAVILVFAGPFFAKRYAPYPYEDRLYPLWANALFAGFPYRPKTYAIKIYRINDKYYEPGVDLFSLFPTWENQTSSPSLIIDAMGRSYLAQNTKAFDSERLTFESTLFKGFETVAYSINLVTWSPIERYLTGKLQKDTLLGHFQYTKTSN